MRHRDSVSLNHVFLSIQTCFSLFMFLYPSLGFINLFICFSLDLNAAESGVQHKPAKKGGQSPFPQENQQSKDNCGC